jgi:hypothetical protein
MKIYINNQKIKVTFFVFNNNCINNQCFKLSTLSILTVIFLKKLTI